MEKKTRPAWEHIKLILWVIFIFEAFLAIIALAIGRVSGYRSAFYICFGIGLAVALVFGSIFLLNILEIIVLRVFKKICTRKHNIDKEHYL